jgi:hypothetical protein
VLVLPGREYQFWQTGDCQLGMARFQRGRWEDHTILADGVWGTPCAQQDAEGKVHVFYRGLDAQVHHLFEDTVGGNF